MYIQIHHSQTNFGIASVNILSMKDTNQCLKKYIYIFSDPQSLLIKLERNQGPLHLHQSDSLGDNVTQYRRTQELKTQLARGSKGDRMCKFTMLFVVI